MQVLRRILTPALTVLAFACICGCSSRDPQVLVTPYVAKAPQPPPAASQPAGSETLVPATPAYERTVIGK